MTEVWQRNRRPHGAGQDRPWLKGTMGPYASELDLSLGSLPTAQKAKTTIILAGTFHEKWSAVFFWHKYMPVTVLQSADIKMRKLDPQRC